MMPNTIEKYREYLFSKSDERERQILLHNINKPHFAEIVAKVLDDYGLAEWLQTAQATGDRLKILDAGCGLGLYLHDIAEILEKRGLLAGALLYGVDNKHTEIMTAIDYSKISRPPRPYLNFYLHDLKTPLEECPGMVVEKGSLVFIYATSVLAFLPNAQEYLLKLYNSLAPGGVLYIRDVQLNYDADHWQAPHPALDLARRATSDMLLKYSGGVDPAVAYAGWLREAGATMVQALDQQVEMGGTSKNGRELLRNYVMATRLAGPMLVQNQVFSQDEVDRIVQTLFTELGPNSIGFTTYTDTLARRPA